MIYPTLTAKLWKRSGNDLYGQARLAAMPDERICPVRLSFQVDSTTVRTDSAGSKGHAQEFNATVVILAMPGTKIDVDDKLEIHGHALRVVERHPRFSVTGRLDHYQVHCVAWK